MMRLLQHHGAALRSHSQRGAALLAAMLTVALVATFAASAAWQQYRAIEIETAERSRVQSGWILIGALDWARLILREDARKGGADDLGEPWAVPLAESRLSSFLAADKDNNAVLAGEDQLDVFLSGQIVDAQSRLNLTNLIDSTGRIHQPTLESLKRLFTELDLNPAELSALAENLRFAKDRSPDNRSDFLAPLMPQRTDQLVWLGLSDTSVQRLKPYVVLLPQDAPINVNTASAEVLAASVPNLDLAAAQRIVSQRALKPYKTLADLNDLTPEQTSAINAGGHSVSSRYFEVRGRLRLEQRVVEEQSLVFRDGIDVKTVWRERTVLNLEAALPSKPAGAPNQ
jgi:general secretion pathway protein K